MDRTVHIFVGQFGSSDAACGYTEPRWEPEPDASASDDDYAAWEDRNPLWPLKADLGVYLNEDFVETHVGDARRAALAHVLTGEGAADAVLRADPTADTVVFVFEGALGGFSARLAATPKLTYVGAFACDLARAR